MKRLRTQLTRISLLGLIASLLVVAYPIENASASLVNVSGTVTLPDGTQVDHLTMVYTPTGLDTETTVNVDPVTGNFSFQASPGSGLLWMTTGGYGDHCSTIMLGNQVISRTLSSVLPACFRSFAQFSIRSDSTIDLGNGNTYAPSAVHIIMPQSVALHFHVIDATTQSPIPFATLENPTSDFVVSVSPNLQNGSPTFPNGSNVLNAPTWVPFGGLNVSDTGSVTTDANGEITIRGFVGNYFAIGAYDHQSLNFIGVDPTNSSRTSSVSIDSLTADQNFTIALPPVEHLAGQITTTSGTAIGNALFEYVPTGSTDSSDHLVQTDANGNFSFDASPGTGMMNIFGGTACTTYRSDGAPSLIVSVPRCSGLDFPVTITADDKISITGSGVNPVDASSWNLTLPDLTTVQVNAVNASDQSPIPGAVLQANNLWGSTDVQVLGTTQHLLWELPETTMTSDAQGQSSFLAWSGNVGGYPNNSGYSTNFPMVLTVADPAHLSRTESATVTSFSSSPITIPVGDLQNFSGTLTVDTSTAVGNIGIVYVPGASVNLAEAYLLNGSATFNNFRFTDSTITDAQGHFSLSATPGEGGIFLLSGGNSRVHCAPRIIGDSQLTDGDLPSVDVPACMINFHHVRVESDGSITDLSTNTNYPSNAVNLSIPHAVNMTIRVVDEITGETLTGIPVSTQTYQLGTHQNYSNTEQNYLSRPFGDTQLVTDSRGEITVPVNSGLWDESPVFAAYDPSNSSRNASFMTDHMDTDTVYVLALPDPPLPPETATATLDSSNSGSATIDWTVPTNDGGLPITDYVVTAEPETSTVALRAVAPIKFTVRTSVGHAAYIVSSVPSISHTLSASSLSHLSDTISGLQSGVTYNFTIKAVNSLGQSQPKIASKHVASSSSSSNSSNSSNSGGGGGGIPMMAPPLSSDTSLKLFTINGSSAGGSSFDLPAGTTSVAVVATATDSGAQVSITGGSNLDTGSNTITVTVTAADGSKKSYSATVNVAAPAPVVAPVPVIAPAPVVVVAPPVETVAPNTPAQPAAPAPVTIVRTQAPAKVTISKPATSAAKAPSVNAVAGQKVNLTIAALPKSTAFTATVLINGKQVKLGSIKSSSSGALAISGFNETKPGTYTIQLTNSKGVKYFIKVIVKATKK